MRELLINERDLLETVGSIFNKNVPIKGSCGDCTASVWMAINELLLSGRAAEVVRTNVSVS